MSCSAEGVRTELSAAVRDLVASTPGATVKARLRAAARALGLPTGRVTDFYYREVRRVEAHEADRIRYRAAEAKRREMWLAQLEAEYQQRRAEFLDSAPDFMARLVPPALGDAREPEATSGKE